MGEYIQPRISNEVLAERVERYFDQNRTEFAAVHHHLDVALQKFDSTIDTVNVMREALHEHQSLPQHSGTRDKLLEYSDRFLEMERKLGQHDREFAKSREEALVARASENARQASRQAGWSMVNYIYLTVLGAIPTAILIYTTFID